MQNDHLLEKWDNADALRRTGQVYRGHRSTVECAAWSPDGLSILSASSDKTLRLWDIATGNTRHTFTGHAAAVNSVAYHPVSLQPNALLRHTNRTTTTTSLSFALEPLAATHSCHL